MSRSFVIVLIFALITIYTEYVLAGTKAIPNPNMIPQLHKDVYTGLTDQKAPSTSTIPTNFNWCATSTGCTSQPQQLTPSYSSLDSLHSTVVMLNDRLRAKTHGLGIPDIQLSRQDYLDHAHNYGLGIDETHHVQPVDVVEYMKRHGLPDETCNPYTGELSRAKTDPEQRCMNCLKIHKDKESHCWYLDDYVKYYVTEYGFISGEDDIQAEILYAGPVQCSMAMDDEFIFNYRGGVYNDDGRLKKTPADTYVEIVGWGEAVVPSSNNPNVNQVRKFWIVRSTLGTNTIGIQGFFLVERGVNAMRIEERCMFARVEASELTKHLEGNTVGTLFGLVSPNDDKTKQYPKDWDSFTHNFKTDKELKQQAKEAKQKEKWIYKNDPNAVKPSKLVKKNEHDDNEQFVAKAGVISDSLVSPKLTTTTTPSSSHPDSSVPPQEDPATTPTPTTEASPTAKVEASGIFSTPSPSPKDTSQTGTAQHAQYEEARILPKSFKIRKIIKYLTMIAFIVFTVAFTFAVYTWYKNNTIPSDYEPIPTTSEEV